MMTLTADNLPDYIIAAIAIFGILGTLLTTWFYKKFDTGMDKHMNRLKTEHIKPIRDKLDEVKELQIKTNGRINTIEARCEERHG